MVGALRVRDVSTSTRNIKEWSSKLYSLSATWLDLWFLRSRVKSLKAPPMNPKDTYWLYAN